MFTNNINGVFVYFIWQTGETSQTANTEAIDAARLKEAFTTMADEDGRITSARLRTFIKQQGFDFTDDEIAEMMKVADPAESGDISYKGAIIWCFMILFFCTEFVKKLTSVIVSHYMHV